MPAKSPAAALPLGEAGFGRDRAALLAAPPPRGGRAHPHGPHARFAGGYGSECVRVRQDLAIAESQLRDYRERLGKPFQHDKYLSELTELRDQLKSKLSATAHESGEERGASASELAEKIKALKGANTIEATPQRVQRKQSTAEEPVPTRIRRRQEAMPASDEAPPHDSASGPGESLPPPVADNASVNMPMPFQQRIVMERQRNEDGPAATR